MNIYGKRVILRAMELSDSQLVIDLFNSPDIENLVVGWAFPVSLYSQDQWLSHHVNDQNSHRFIIETSDNNKAVGIATLTDIDWKNRNASHGIKILDKNMRKKGIGTDTIMAMMRYAFDELGLVRLDSSWFPENVASSGMYKKCGWKEEGIKRKCIFKKGQFRDLVICGVLAEDYHELIRENNYWGEEAAQ